MDPQLLGTSLLGATALLSGWLLMQKLRETFAENPDPKTTYATRRELDRTRDELRESVHGNSADFAAAHRLIHRNAEHIAALMAREDGTQRRLNELHGKVDRLLERVADLSASTRHATAPSPGPQ
ncbi:MAG: hypothetical protein ACFB21_04960 [Opitutales bacterium]